MVEFPRLVLGDFNLILLSPELEAAQEFLTTMLLTWAIDYLFSWHDISVSILICLLVMKDLDYVKTTQMMAEQYSSNRFTETEDILGKTPLKQVLHLDSSKWEVGHPGWKMWISEIVRKPRKMHITNIFSVTKFPLLFNVVLGKNHPVQVLFWTSEIYT